jgi:hypothetical protein
MGPSTNPPMAERALIDHPRDKRGKFTSTPHHQLLIHYSSLIMPVD